MDVLQVIQADHDEFRRQLEALTENASAAREKSVKLFNQLSIHLTAHHETEEELIFKRLQKLPQAKEVIEEAWEEHEAIDLYMKRMKQSHKTERWSGKTAVLKELVEHHLDEEEGEVFAQVRDALANELTALGEKFEKSEKRRMSKV